MDCSYRTEIDSHTNMVFVLDAAAKAQLSSADLDEAVQEMLEANRELRRKMDEEIQEMRARSVKIAYLWNA